MGEFNSQAAGFPEAAEVAHLRAHMQGQLPAAALLFQSLSEHRLSAQPEEKGFFIL